MKIHLINKSSKRYIKLNLFGDAIKREFGMIGTEKPQFTSHTYDFLNKNKANELSPEEAAKEDYDRIIKNKKKEGYIDIEDNDSKSFNINTILPINESFCCSKPKTSISEKEFNNIQNKIILKKYNGSCHYILIDNNEDVKIYTRRWEDHTIKYPMIVKTFKRKIYENLIFKNSLYIGEMIVTSDNHMESQSLIASISKLDTLKGKPKDDQTQTYDFINNLANENKYVNFIVFGCLFYNGVDLLDLNYKHVFNFTIYDIFQDTYYVKIPDEYSFEKYDEMIDFLKENKKEFEGFVIVNSDKNFEISYTGKPKRRMSYKVKVKSEIDVVADGYVKGKGKNQNKIGSLKIFLFNENNQYVSMGTVGSGLNDELRDPNKWNFPCVVEVEYDNIFPATDKNQLGRFQFPVFKKIHEDKTIEDLKNI